MAIANPNHSAIATTSNTDVLIVGAGPAGLMAATALTKAGVSVRIVDKRPTRVMVGQADGCQPRTMEVLQSYGLRERLRDGGMSNDMVIIGMYGHSKETDGLKLTRRVPASNPAGRFHAMSAHQGTFEENFIHYLSTVGVRVDRPMVPTSLKISDDPKALADHDSYPVSVTLASTSGGKVEEVVSAKYVIGADGARSWVRDTIEIPMIGENTEHVWGVLDIRPDTDFPDIRHINVINARDSRCMIIPREKNLIRFYIQLDDMVGDKTTVSKDDFTWEQIFAVGKAALRPFRIETKEPPEWWSVYKIRQQVATRYESQQRVFIVGDACHTHSPKAGQGMNASINDSHNLAWKLTHVLRQWAHPDILRSYEAERRDFALKLIAFDQTINNAMSKKLNAHSKPGEDIDPDYLSGLYVKFSSFISGVGIKYDPGLMVKSDNQELAQNLFIGTRFPPAPLVQAASGHASNLQDLAPSNTLYKLFIFAGDVSNSCQFERVRQGVQSLNRFLHTGAGRIASLMNVYVIGYGMDITEMSASLVKGVSGLDWSQIYADASTAFAPAHGETHAALKIDAAGLAVLVRPDGYMGAFAGLGNSTGAQIHQYFGDIYSGMLSA